MRSTTIVKWAGALSVLVGCACAYLLFSSGPALAHPLGNFTVNRYSLLEVGARAIEIAYVLDMAEVPAFQEIRQIDTNRNQVVEEDEEQAFASARANELQGNLRLFVNGAPTALEVLTTHVTFPPGEGGLATLRLEARYRALLFLPERVTVTVEYQDLNYPERIGWKEVVARPSDGVEFRSSTVPAIGRSEALTVFPNGEISSPPDVTTASITYVLTAGAELRPIEDAPVEARTRAPPAKRTDPLGALLAREKIGAGIVMLAIAISAGIGGLHALTPGHGKTIMAAYLIGTRGTARHAVMLGLTVAVSHTIGVLALGAITLYASSFLTPESTYPYLGLGAGVLVTGIGVSMLYRRLRSRSAHHEHDHGHVHGAGEDHHHHRAAPAAGVTWRGLLAIGLADGAVPSASALIVWLAAISLNRIGLGLGMVTAFGLGMAAALTAVGVVLLRARATVGEKLAGRSALVARFLRALPWITAVLVIGAGLLMAARAIMASGWF